MYRVATEFIAAWKTSSGERWPRSVDMICPHCGRQVNFALPNWHKASQVDSYYATSRCSGCSNYSNFFWVGNPREEEESREPTYDLYIHPTPKLIRQPIAGIDEVDEFSEALEKAYAAAVNTYNVRQWTAAAVLCGRVLEGLTKSLLPEEDEKLPLAKQLQALPDHVELEKPILTLADGIRRGRNIGAHFDIEREPDEETAEMMLNLLDYLIEYIFILPGRIDRLHDRLAESEDGAEG